MDKVSATAFINTFLGYETIGVDENNEEISRLKAPLTNAHLKAILGANLPTHILPHNSKDPRRMALLEYLRNVLLTLEVEFIPIAALKSISLKIENGKLIGLDVINQRGERMADYLPVTINEDGKSYTTPAYTLPPVSEDF